MLNIVTPNLLATQPKTLSHQSFVVQAISSWFSLPNYVHTIPANKAKNLIASIYGFKSHAAFKASLSVKVPDQHLELPFKVLEAETTYQVIHQQLGKIFTGRFNSLLAYVLTDYFIGLMENRWDEYQIIDCQSLLLINLISKYPSPQLWGQKPCELFLALNNVGNFMTAKSYCRMNETDGYMDKLVEIAEQKNTFLHAVEFHSPRYNDLKFPRLFKTYNYVFNVDGQLLDKNLSNAQLKPLIQPRLSKVANKSEFIEKVILRAPYFEPYPREGIGQHFRNLGFLKASTINQINLQSDFLDNVYTFLTNPDIELLDSKFHFDQFGLRTLTSYDRISIEIKGEIELAGYGLHTFSLLYKTQHAIKTHLSPSSDLEMKPCIIGFEKPKSLQYKLDVYNGDDLVCSNSPVNKLNVLPFTNQSSDTQALFSLWSETIYKAVFEKVKDHLSQAPFVMINLFNSLSESYLRKQINFADTYVQANMDFQLLHCDMPLENKKEIMNRQVHSVIPSTKYFPLVAFESSVPTFREFLHHITLLHEVSYKLFKNGYTYHLSGDRFNAALQQVYEYLKQEGRYLPIKDYSVQELAQINIFLNRVFKDHVHVRKLQTDPTLGEIKMVRKSKLNKKGRKLIKTTKEKAKKKKARLALKEAQLKTVESKV